MATSGGFTIGVKYVPPIPPRLLIVNEPPCISDGWSLPALVFSAIAASSTESSTMLFLSTSRMTGTISPRSVSTATPTCMYFFITIDSPAMSIERVELRERLERRRQ